MPRKTYAKKKRRNVRKRVYRKRRSRTAQMSYPSGGPSQRTVKMRYSQSVVVSSTSGVMGTTIFRANSIHDPDYTGVGHQPMGHDTWQTLYNHYVVLGSKISVRLLPSATNASPAIAGIYLSDGSTAPYLTGTTFIEAKKGTFSTFVPDQSRPKNLVSKFSAKKFFNVKDVKDNIPTLGSSFGNTPSDASYYQLWYQTLDGSTESIQAVVTIDYIVAMSEPKDLPIS